MDEMHFDQILEEKHSLSLYMSVVTPMLVSQGWMDEPAKKIVEDLQRRYPDGMAPYDAHIKFDQDLFPVDSARCTRIFTIGTIIRPYHFGKKANIALANTGREVLESLCLALEDPFPSIIFDLQDSYLDIGPKPAGWEVVPQAHMFTTGFFVGTLRWLCDEDIIRSIRFGFEQPEWWQDLQDAAACPLEFKGDVTRIYFDLEKLDQPIR